MRQNKPFFGKGCFIVSSLVSQSLLSCNTVQMSSKYIVCQFRISKQDLSLLISFFSGEGGGELVGKVLCKESTVSVFLFLLNFNYIIFSMGIICHVTINNIAQLKQGLWKFHLMLLVPDFHVCSRHYSY